MDSGDRIFIHTIHDEHSVEAWVTRWEARGIFYVDGSREAWFMPWSSVRKVQLIDIKNRVRESLERPVT